MEWKAFEYQKFGLRHIINNNSAGLFLDMGLGKTVITATAVDQLLNLYLAATRVLVIAPKRVALKVWADECAKWDHLKHLKLSIAVGTQRQRIKALSIPADIYVINRENVEWLVAYYGSKWPFDMVIFDESSSFKNASSKRFKAIKKALPFVYRKVILTGTPAPNNLIDLWSQIFLLDQGERLGEYITHFRKNLFYPEKFNGHHVFKYAPKENTQKKIQQLIGDVCISMNAKDYLKLPKSINRVIDIDFPKALKKDYLDFEREKFLELSTKEITVANAAVLVGKLLQFSNGFLYDENKQAHDIHDLKLEAVEEILEGINGQPLLLAYWFKHDLQRLLSRFGKRYRCSLVKDNREIDDWNKGNVEIGLLNPASAAHGLNLQQGGHLLCWYGPIHSLELYQQFNARIDRQGQKYSVIKYHVLTNGTMDIEVMKSLHFKDQNQNNLLAAIKAKVKMYRQLYSKK